MKDKKALYHIFTPILEFYEHNTQWLSRHANEIHRTKENKGKCKNNTHRQLLCTFQLTYCDHVRTIQIHHLHSNCHALGVNNKDENDPYSVCSGSLSSSFIILQNITNTLTDPTEVKRTVTTSDQTSRN